MVLPFREAPLLVEKRCLALLSRPSWSMLSSDLACAKVLCLVELVAFASFAVPHLAATFDDVIVVRRIHQQLVGVRSQCSLYHVLRVLALGCSNTIWRKCLYLGQIPRLLIVVPALSFRLFFSPSIELAFPLGCGLLQPLELLLLSLLSFFQPPHPQLLQGLIIKVFPKLKLVELLMEDKAMEEGLVAVEVRAFERVEGRWLVGIAQEDLSWENELDIFLVCTWVRIHAEQDLWADLLDLAWAKGAREQRLRHSRDEEVLSQFARLFFACGCVLHC